jgi:hypothetical protein
VFHRLLCGPAEARAVLRSSVLFNHSIIVAADFPKECQNQHQIAGPSADLGEALPLRRAKLDWGIDQFLKVAHSVLRAPFLGLARLELLGRLFQRTLG